MNNNANKCWCEVIEQKGVTQNIGAFCEGMELIETMREVAYQVDTPVEIIRNNAPRALKSFGNGWEYNLEILHDCFLLAAHELVYGSTIAHAFEQLINRWAFYCNQFEPVAFEPNPILSVDLDRCRGVSAPPFESLVN